MAAPGPPLTRVHAALGLLRPHVPGNAVSAGPINGRRVAVRPLGDAPAGALGLLAASHNTLLAVDVALPPPGPAERPKGDRSGLTLGPPERISEASCSPVPLPPGLREIAAVATCTASPLAAAVDTVGRVVCGPLCPASGPEAPEPAFKRPRLEVEVRPAWDMFAEAPPFADAGWAGLEFDPLQADRLCVVREAAADLVAFVGRDAERRIPLGLKPSAMTYCQHGDLQRCVAVAEGALLSFFDLRVAGAAARVRQLQVGHSTIFALATSPSHPTVAAAGEARAIFVVEPRKWQVRSAWPAVLKYDCTALFYSAAMPEVWVAGGAHSELRGGSGPKAQEASCAFFADSGWLGLAQREDGTFCGLSEKGSVYVLQPA
eukprot:EG_transcript_16396